MVLFKTNAIIVKAYPFRDYDKRVVMLTRDHGKLTAIAPYAQKSKKRFGAGLETLTLVSAEIREKETSSLVRLQEVKIIDSFAPLKKDIIKIAYGSYFLEVVSEVMREKESASALFDFLHYFLKGLQKTKNEAWLARFFEIKLLNNIGFKPELENCIRCKKALKGLEGRLGFSVAAGGLFCGECLLMREPECQRISIETVTIIKKMITTDKLFPLDQPEQGDELKNLLPSFLFYQLGKAPISFRLIESLA